MARQHPVAEQGVKDVSILCFIDDAMLFRYYGTVNCLSAASRSAGVLQEFGYNAKLLCPLCPGKTII